MFFESDFVALETPVESPRGQSSNTFTAQIRAAQCLMFATSLRCSELVMASGVEGQLTEMKGSLGTLKGRLLAS